MSELIYPQESYILMGACFEIYNEKGCGFHEPVCHDCVEIELGLYSRHFASFAGDPIP